MINSTKSQKKGKSGVENSHNRYDERTDHEESEYDEGSSESNTTEVESFSTSTVSNDSNSISDSTISEREWPSYLERLQKCMIEVYQATYDDLLSSDDATSNDDNEEDIMIKSQKQFRKRLINCFIIYLGMKEDERLGNVRVREM